MLRYVNFSKRSRVEWRKFYHAASGGADVVHQVWEKLAQKPETSYCRQNARKIQQSALRGYRDLFVENSPSLEYPFLSRCAHLCTRLLSSCGKETKNKATVTELRVNWTLCDVCVLNVRPIHFNVLIIATRDYFAKGTTIRLTGCSTCRVPSAIAEE